MPGRARTETGDEQQAGLSREDYHDLLAFRRSLRRFLHFSQATAAASA